MQILRGTILAIGLMSFAFACGGSKKEAAEPTPNPCAEANPCAGGEMGGDEAAPAEGMGDENPCAAADEAGGEENPCEGAE